MKAAFTVAAAFILTASVAAAQVEQQPPAPAPAPAAAVAPAAPTASGAAPTGAAPADWMSYHSPYAAGMNDLSTPHRTAEEIISWSQSMIAEAMTFAPTDFNAKLTNLKKSFTPQGWQEYGGYLKDSKIADMVRQQNLNINTVVGQDIAITNSASVAGSYHWIINAPVIISIVRANDSGEMETVSGAKYKLTLQIGRSATAGNEDGIAVEGWKMTLQ